MLYVHGIFFFCKQKKLENTFCKKETHIFLKKNPAKVPLFSP